MKTAAANMFRRRSDRKMKLDAKKYDEMRKGRVAALAAFEGLPVGVFRGRCHLPFGRGPAHAVCGPGLHAYRRWHTDERHAHRPVGLYHSNGLVPKLAAKAGAGTLVPITGFANAVVAPAIEFRNEGLVSGVGAKMFIIAGPVIVYGMLASVGCGGVIYHFIRPLMGG